MQAIQGDDAFRWETGKPSRLFNGNYDGVKWQQFGMLVQHAAPQQFLRFANSQCPNFLQGHF